MLGPGYCQGCGARVTGLERGYRARVVRQGQSQGWDRPRQSQRLGSGQGQGQGKCWDTVQMVGVGGRWTVGQTGGGGESGGEANRRSFVRLLGCRFSLEQLPSPKKWAAVATPQKMGNAVATPQKAGVTLELSDG